MRSADVGAGCAAAEAAGRPGGSAGGIAVVLGEAGHTVYVTGRSTDARTTYPRLGGSVEQTARELTAAGGRGVAVPCDHTDDEQAAVLAVPLPRPGGGAPGRRVLQPGELGVAAVDGARPASVRPHFEGRS